MITEALRYRNQLPAGAVCSLKEIPIVMTHLARSSADVSLIEQCIGYNDIYIRRQGQFLCGRYCFSSMKIRGFSLIHKTKK